MRTHVRKKAQILGIFGVCQELWTLLASNVMSMNTTTKRILLGSAANTSLKLSRLATNPACIAGVLTSHPNFNALCGLMKL